MSDIEAGSLMAEEARPDGKTVQVLRDMANRLRIHSIRATCASSSGHPTSCSSAAEIMSVLFFHTMRYKQSDPENPDNDRFILSKVRWQGNPGPVLMLRGRQTWRHDQKNLQQHNSTR
uniref:Transketolase N-terminal domain-containing protein n=1 Tax=Spermophilus dauricus TaxID=99837 RepID=A0A8C9QC77_SPEDA